MKYIRTYSDHVDEMANITKTGKKVYADDKLLKTMNVQELKSNIVLYHEKKGNIFAAPGKFWIWFTDTPEWYEKLKVGEYDILPFPFRHRFDWNAAPIKDIWKKKHQKGFRGSEHVIGVVEGFVDEEKKTVTVEMMSVKPPYKRNRINSLMLDAAKDKFPDYKIIFEDPTDDGYLFMKKYMPDAEVSWTISHRPKAWKADHPEDGPKVKIVAPENTEA